ncbi:chymotrypsin inhibitor-like [Anastrepha obliqua]|uniref:chymotrypsin inhibitor-like n=1 Tax=Anastrepha obliqua TaxID=95512 RepID=UPI00240A06DE|nr:chymotrypsin inhibitor-like [Anastrepha obliqua]
MNNKIVLLCLVVVCFIASVSAKPQRGGSCGKNQEFTNCGSACPPKCDDGNGPTICTLQCIIGCQCRRGYLLNSAGQCVEPRKC